MSTYTFSYIIIIIVIIIVIVALDGAGWLNLKFFEEESLGGAGYHVHNMALCTIPLPMTTGLWYTVAQNLSLPLRFPDWSFICVCEPLFVLPALPHIVLAVITLITSDERYVFWFLRLQSPPSSNILIPVCSSDRLFSYSLSVYYIIVRDIFSYPFKQQLMLNSFFQKLVIYQQMHYLLHFERFNFTQEIT
jgi:hypothetical protein